MTQHTYHDTFSSVSTVYYDGRQIKAQSEPPLPIYNGFEVNRRDENADDVALGVDDSGWRQKMAAGQGVNHSYGRTASRVASRKPYHFSSHYRTNNPFAAWNVDEYVTAWGDAPTRYIVYGVADSTAVNQAVSSFVSKAQSYLSPFQGGTFLGELRETIHTIRHPCEGVKKLIGSYLTGLKKARPGFRKATNQRRAKHIASQWLEVSYGIRPLLSDISSGCKALNDIVNRQSNSPTIKGFGNAYSRAEPSVGNILGVRHGRVFFEITTETYTKAVYYGAVRMDLNSPSQFALEKLGLTPDQFLPTIWELIPYSFLVDYFTNVGQIVQAVSFPTSRLVFSGATTSVRSVVTAHAYSCDNGNNPDVEVLGFLPGQKSIETTSMSRSDAPSLIPSVSISIPTGVSQWTNMLALAVQARAITPY